MAALHRAKQQIMSLAKKLRTFADRLDSPDAVAARRLNVPLDLYRCFERIKNDFGIRTIFDVGANRGEFAKACAVCFPDAVIHCFEPLPGCQTPLKNLASHFSKITIHSVALGEIEHIGEMFENEYSPSSSLLRMEQRHRDLWPKATATKKVDIVLKRLDGVVARERPAAPFFLKLDVQGYEMSVLRGATETLRQTAVVMTEVLFEPLYAGQADFLELINFMAGNGFRFVEFADERRLPPLDKLIYADAIFVNEQFHRRNFK
jgi:FkbM family methyltransferase